MFKKNDNFSILRENKDELDMDSDPTDIAPRGQGGQGSAERWAAEM